jgi:hypothetical protein
VQLLERSAASALPAWLTPATGPLAGCLIYICHRPLAGCLIYICHRPLWPPAWLTPATPPLAACLAQQVRLLEGDGV